MRAVVHAGFPEDALKSGLEAADRCPIAIAKHELVGRWLLPQFLSPDCPQPIEVVLKPLVTDDLALSRFTSDGQHEPEVIGQSPGLRDVTLLQPSGLADPDAGVREDQDVLMEVQALAQTTPVPRLSSRTGPDRRTAFPTPPRGCRDAGSVGVT